MVSCPRIKPAHAPGPCTGSSVPTCRLARNRHHKLCQQQHRTRTVRCQAEPLSFDISKYANKSYLDQAAKRFMIGLSAGMEEEELIAKELGVMNTSQLSEAQQKYKDKIKEKLIKRAEEMRREEEELKARQSKNFILGQEAYECGEYLTAVQLLEQGVQDAGEDTALGGEVQLWLALAYQACGREQDCIDLYKKIEENHPIKKIRKQAYDLRYIIEAPKMPLTEEDRVQIPLIQSDTWRAKERKSFKKATASQGKVSAETYWDRAKWDIPTPSFMPDKWYYRVLWAVLLVGLTVYLNSQLLVTRALTDKLGPS